MNGDGTLTDNQTGLMWEIETTTCSGEVTCYTNMYRWAGAGSPADGGLFTVFLAALNGGDYYSPSAGQVVSAAPGNCFANRCDWRIPTEAELLTIIDPECSSGSACIDPVFGPTQPSLYWTSSTLASDLTWAWNVKFSIGPGGGFFLKQIPEYARGS